MIKKPRNPQDLTLRNLRAIKLRVLRLELRLALLEGAKVSRRAAR